MNETGGLTVHDAEFKYGWTYISVPPTCLYGLERENVTLLSPENGIASEIKLRLVYTPLFLINSSLIILNTNSYKFYHCFRTRIFS